MDLVMESILFSNAFHSASSLLSGRARARTTSHRSSLNSAPGGMFRNAPLSTWDISAVISGASPSPAPGRSSRTRRMRDRMGPQQIPLLSDTASSILLKNAICTRGSAPARRMASADDSAGRARTRYENPCSASSGDLASGTCFSMILNASSGDLPSSGPGARAGPVMRVPPHLRYPGCGTGLPSLASLW